MYVVQYILEQLEGFVDKVHEYVGVMATAVHQEIIQLLQAKLFTLDQLLAALLDKQLKIAKPDGYRLASQ